jgi:hypothetical protein
LASPTFGSCKGGKLFKISKKAIFCLF